MQCTSWRHRVVGAVMDMMGKSWQTWEVRRIIPTSNEMAFLTGPVVAVGHHLKLSIRCPLDILRKFELAAIGKYHTSSQVRICDAHALAHDRKAFNAAVTQDVFLDGNQVFGRTHAGTG